MFELFDKPQQKLHGNIEWEKTTNRKTK